MEHKKSLQNNESGQLLEIGNGKVPIRMTIERISLPIFSILRMSKEELVEKVSHCIQTNLKSNGYLRE